MNKIIAGSAAAAVIAQEMVTGVLTAGGYTTAHRRRREAYVYINIYIYIWWDKWYDMTEK